MRRPYHSLVSFLGMALFFNLVTPSEARSADVSGVCGSANGIATSSMPTANLCDSGIASSVYGSGPWVWVCLGSGNGSNISCDAPYASGGGTVTTKAKCGKADGTTVSKKPSTTSDLCSVGTSSSVDTGSSSFTWTCAKDATEDSCSATIASALPEATGVCGDSQGKTLSVVPSSSSDLCSVGTASSVVEDTSLYAWTCIGSRHTVPCWANININSNNNNNINSNDNDNSNVNVNSNSNNNKNSNSSPNANSNPSNSNSSNSNTNSSSNRCVFQTSEDCDEDYFKSKYASCSSTPGQCNSGTPTGGARYNGVVTWLCVGERGPAVPCTYIDSSLYNSNSSSSTGLVAQCDYENKDCLVGSKIPTEGNVWICETKGNGSVSATCSPDSSSSTTTTPATVCDSKTVCATWAEINYKSIYCKGEYTVPHMIIEAVKWRCSNADDTVSCDCPATESPTTTTTKCGSAATAGAVTHYPTENHCQSGYAYTAGSAEANGDGSYIYKWTCDEEQCTATTGNVCAQDLSSGGCIPSDWSNPNAALPSTTNAVGTAIWTCSNNNPLNQAEEVECSATSTGSGSCSPPTYDYLLDIIKDKLTVPAYNASTGVAYKQLTSFAGGETVRIFDLGAAIDKSHAHKYYAVVTNGLKQMIFNTNNQYKAFELPWSGCDSETEGYFCYAKHLTVDKDSSSIMMQGDGANKASNTSVVYATLGINGSSSEMGRKDKIGAANSKAMADIGNPTSSSVVTIFGPGPKAYQTESGCKSESNTDVDARNKTWAKHFQLNMGCWEQKKEAEAKGRSWDCEDVENMD